jgi:drug/metabolite transporter (DMT)-like permease
MSTAIVGLVLMAALMHASWNALVKQSEERLLTFAILIGTGALAYLPIAIITGPPSPKSFPWLAASGSIHIAYYAALLLGYRYGDLGQVYPIARGTGPLVVAVLGALLVDEVPSAGAAIGIALVSLGVLALAKSAPEQSARAPLYALLTGFLIAGYTTCDGLGVRSSEHKLAYLAWLHVVGGVPFAGSVLLARRRDLARFWRQSGKRAALGGIVGAAAYSIVVWAMSISPLAWVAALRETSVVAAAAIGARLLGEPFGARRIAAACVVACGVILVSIS